MIRQLSAHARVCLISSRCIVEIKAISFERADENEGGGRFEYKYIYMHA